MTLKESDLKILNSMLKQYWTPYEMKPMSPEEIELMRILIESCKTKKTN